MLINKVYKKPGYYRNPERTILVCTIVFCLERVEIKNETQIQANIVSFEDNH